MQGNDVNPKQGVEKLLDAAAAAPADLIKYLAIALVVLIVLYIALRILTRRKPTQGLPLQDLTINVMGLPTDPPPPGPSLYYYDVPVRLTALVLAPVGRVRDLPPFNDINDVLDSMVPGLSAVVASHRPLYRRWPHQLSSRGFAHAFFSHARLPGKGGKGSPWCSVAGVFKLDGQPFMAGLVLRAQTTTNLGQRTIEDEAQWLDILRIKS